MVSCSTDVIILCCYNLQTNTHIYMHYINREQGFFGLHLKRLKYPFLAFDRELKERRKGTCDIIGLKFLTNPGQFEKSVIEV